MGNKRFYLDETKLDGALKITMARDTAVDKLIEFYNNFANLKVFKDIIGENIPGDSILYLDDTSDSVIIRLSNKKFLLISGSESLLIDSKMRKYTFSDAENTYISDKLSREDKGLVFDKITLFMSYFNSLNKALPVDLTINCLFAYMGLLDKRRFLVVANDDKILLCLNDFRKVNPEGMKLTIADASTFETVGTIEFYLNLKGQDNFSFSGNVEYNISEEYSNNGYASSALALLKSYINSLSDEYNKELYVATLVEDLYYQQVAIKNGGVLAYDGPIPKGERLRSLNKIDDIKIYKIENK
ncbi:MAG: hypothetical protein J1F35_01355 [Erysipelotrichales bacterium]|nr:hypothetical protein [Erysipelotrichales bacterium]